MCACIPEVLRAPSCGLSATADSSARQQIKKAFRAVSGADEVQKFAGVRDLWDDFAELQKRKQHRAAVLLGSGPGLSAIADSTWAAVAANADTWTLNSGIFFASVVPIRFAHIEMNKQWAVDALARNLLLDCNATARESLRRTTFITNRYDDCLI